MCFKKFERFEIEDKYCSFYLIANKNIWEIQY